MDPTVSEVTPIPAPIRYNRTMDRARLGILISGRGSNMMAIVASCEAGKIPAEVALVVSNKASAAGLEGGDLEQRLMEPSTLAAARLRERRVATTFLDAAA